MRDIGILLGVDEKRGKQKKFGPPCATQQRKLSF